MYIVIVLLSNLMEPEEGLMFTLRLFDKKIQKQR